MSRNLKMSILPPSAVLFLLLFPTFANAKKNEAPQQAGKETAQATAGNPEAYVIDADHTRVEFEVPHLVVSTVKGHFGVVGGEFTFAPGNASQVRLEAFADVASISTGQDKRDNHLRSADFFDAKRFPKITFVSRSAKPTGAQKFDLTGDFTMHNVTKQVTFQVEFKGEFSAYDKKRVAFKAKTQVNRKDFGMTFNTLADSVPLVGDVVDIVIVAEGLRKSDL